MKVSFDFDGTLSKEAVQVYAKNLVSRGIEVWIVTARLSDDKAPNVNYNDDLYDIAAYVGIERDRIIFTDMSEKYHYFRNRNFVWHVDDHWPTLGLINRFTGTRGISIFGTNFWCQECEYELIKRKHEIKS